MNANAPEKIYIGVVPSDLGNNKYTTVGKDFPDAEEYAHVDAFIKKAEKYLREHLIDYWSQEITDEHDFIAEFKQFMKGE